MRFVSKWLLIFCHFSFQWIDEVNVAEVSGSRSVIVEAPASRRIISEESSPPVTPPVATATMAPFATNLDDVFISVKTTKHYHHSRLPAIIATWFQFAKDQVSLPYTIVFVRLIDPCNVDISDRSRSPALFRFLPRSCSSFIINITNW